MSRDSKDLTELLQNVWNDTYAWYKVAYPNNELFLTCTYRSPEEQANLYAQGRTRPGNVITNCDGYKLKSKHNHKPSRAFDFAIKVHSMVTWDINHFKPVINAIKSSKYKDKIRCGADFKKPVDYPHIEEI